MGYWNKNLKDIEKYRATLKEFLIEDNQKNIEVRKVGSDAVPYYNGLPLYSLEGINIQIDEIIEKGKKDLKKKVILIFGFGFGYLVEKVLDLVSKDTVVITVDPNITLIRKALEHRDLRRVIRDPRFIMGVLKEDTKKLSVLLSPHINNILTGGLGLFFDPSVKIYNKEFYINLKKELIDYLRTISIHFNTISTLEFAFVQNTFFNAPHYVTQPGIQLLKDKYTDIPAIVVSAGPSLNKNIDKIKHAKGRAIIIALGPTFKPLLKHGVVPDFVVAIDPVDLQIRMFEKKEEETKESILVTLPYFNFKAFRLWKGKVLWMGKEDPLVNFFDDASDNPHDKIDTGMTVAHSAFSFANYIGANPIILVGQDLSYPTDKTHVDGAPLVRDVKLDPKSIIWVEGNYEEKVPTVRNLFSYIYLFEEMANRVREINPNKLLINATEGGARIKGFEIMTFQEVLDTYIAKDALKLKDEVLREEIPEYVSPNREKLFDHIDNAIKDFYTISRITYDLIKDIKTLSLEPTQKDIEVLNKKIVDIQEEVITKKHFKLFEKFFEVYERKKIKREKELAEKYKNKKSKEDFIKEVEEQKKKSITYYSEIFTIANFFGNMMEFVKGKIKEKIERADIR